MATESLIEAVGYHLVPMYRVIGSVGIVPGEHLEDAAGHCDQGNCDHEDQRLRMVADGGLLGHFFPGGSGTCAVSDGQGA